MAIRSGRERTSGMRLNETRSRPGTMTSGKNDPSYRVKARQTGARGRRHGNPLVYGSTQAKSTDVPHGLITARTSFLFRPILPDVQGPGEDPFGPPPGPPAPYLTSTVAPAASSFSLAASAWSFGTRSRT